MSITNMIVSGASDYQIRKKYDVSPKGVIWIQDRIFSIMNLPEDQRTKGLRDLDDLCEKSLSRHRDE